MTGAPLPLPFAALGLLLAATGAPASPDPGHREVGAHAHGLSRVDLVVDGAAIAIDLISPAADIVGFGHPPRDDADRAALAAAVEQLQRGDELFRPTAAARCELTRAEVRADQLHDEDPESDDGHGHGHEHDHGHAGDHADFRAEYRYECAEPDHLAGMAVTFFQVFDATETMVVRMSTANRQTRVELAPTRHRLRF